MVYVCEGEIGVVGGDGGLKIVEVNNVECGDEGESVGVNMGEVEKGGLGELMVKEMLEEGEWMRECMG